MTTMPQRMIRAVDGSDLAEGLARVQERLYGPLIERARRSALHTGVLGHSLHPSLTDVTAGCWLSASLLDVAGGAASRRAATLLAGLGLVAAVPTALAGAADWSETSGPDRRVGAVHSLCTDAATGLFAASLVARLRGRHGAGVGLAAAGNLAVAAAGLLGGHLALARGTARRLSPGERD